MRAILLTRDGGYYVLSEIPGTREPAMVSGLLATGGEVVVPIDNVAAIEIYQDRQIEVFRARLDELRPRVAAATIPCGCPSE